MPIDSAHLRYAAPPAPATARPLAGAAASMPERRPPAGRAGDGSVGTVELGIPAAPPPDALEWVNAAARCAEELARNNRELHFRADEHSHRIIIEVRDMSGNVIRTIPPSKALDLITASPGKENQWLA